MSEMSLDDTILYVPRTVDIVVDKESWRNNVDPLHICSAWTEAYVHDMGIDIQDAVYSDNSGPVCVCVCVCVRVAHISSAYRGDIMMISF